MDTIMGKEMLADFDADALSQIAEACAKRVAWLENHARSEDAERTFQIGAHFGDAKKFRDLEQAIINLSN